MGGIILAMLVFHIVTSFLFHFGVSDTILQNGEDPQYGKFYLLFFLYTQQLSQTSK